MRWSLAISLAGMAVCVATAAPGDQLRYSITPLARVGPSGADVTVAGVNNGGIAVGSDNGVAVRWDASGSATPLPHLNPIFPQSGAAGVNNFGVVVGSSGGVAVKWDQQGNVLPLGHPDLPGYTSTGATAVNDAGFAVGIATHPSLGTRAVLWDPAGSATVLPILVGHTTSYAADINAYNVAVGSAQDGQGSLAVSRAIRWDAQGNVAVLGPPGAAYSKFANGLNDGSIIVGTGTYPSTSFPNETNSYAVYWDTSGFEGFFLSFPGPFAHSGARDINDRGAAVGWTYSQICCPGANGTGGGPVLWDPDYGPHPIDLSYLIDGGTGWNLSTAPRISDTGFIAGTGTFEGSPRGYLLTPVPEPAIITGSALLACISLRLRGSHTGWRGGLPRRLRRGP